MVVDLLPYADRLESRARSDIDLAVIHCTELPDLATARAFGERIHHLRSGTGNSGHYYIEENGAVHCWVPAERIAHHVRGYNERSIGIELCNPGRYPDWWNSHQPDMDQPYSDAQVDSLVALLKQLCAELPALARISGHEHLDRTTIPSSDNPDVLVPRKRDPGPLFPWPQLLESVPLEFLDGDA
jgi:N-acetylmuramoyl-L-alanine amidase